MLSGNSVNAAFASSAWFWAIPILYSKPPLALTKASIGLKLSALLDSMARVICQAIENKSAESFNLILALVKAKGGLEYSIGMAQQQAELAKAALAELPESIYKDVMLELADFSVARNN